MGHSRMEPAKLGQCSTQEVIAWDAWLEAQWPTQSTSRLAAKILTRGVKALCLGTSSTLSYPLVLAQALFWKLHCKSKLN